MAADGGGMAFVACLCLFAACFFPPVGGFSEEWLRPKWVLALVVTLVSLLGLGVGLLRVGRAKGTDCVWRTGSLKTAFCEAAVCVSVLECVYVVGLALGAKGGAVPTGTFDNPAGLAFCLCVCLPFLACLWPSWRGRWRRILLVACGVLMVSVVLLSRSRTGWICLAVYALWLLWHGWKARPAVKWGAALLLAGALAWGVLAFKPDSTSGRHFILACSWELVEARPWTGHGRGGFLREYMPRQEAYFRQHPDSREAWLADEVYHPLNEFVWLWVEHGVLGVGLLLAAFVGLLVGLSRRPGWFARAWAASVCALWVFSWFSYPFKYPLAVVVLVASVLVACRGLAGRVVAGRCRPRWVGSCLLAVSVLGLAAVVHSYSYEYRWSRAARQALRGRSLAVMPDYAALYAHYRRDASFLYNYAAEQFYAGQYEEARATAKACQALWPSYNLSLLTGDICRAAGRYGEAAVHYEQAHWKCPVRFAPLEGLYYAYKLGGCRAKADSVAAVVARKRVKVDSPDVRRIQRELYDDVRRAAARQNE